MRSLLRLRRPISERLRRQNRNYCTAEPKRKSTQQSKLIFDSDAHKKPIRRIFSGIQPTGDMHLGNYLGAIKNWVNLQNQYSGSSKIYFCIVDLHSLTTSLNRDALVKSTRELTATLLACGIDPSKAVLYNQSKVAGHSELSWILTCLTPMSMLKMMTQFKDKSKTQKDPLTGLYSYPILMAADILLFKASHVPVGEDQIQHIELTRELAGKFNRSFGVDLFPIPEVLLTPTRRVMSLRDASKKMSKSDPSDLSRISITDSADSIREKITRAKTDLISGVSHDPENRPEVANLISIFSAMSKRSIEDICSQYGSTDLLAFKKGLIDVTVAELEPIRKEYLRLMNDVSYLDKILKQGGDAAHADATRTLQEVRGAAGLV